MRAAHAAIAQPGSVAFTFGLEFQRGLLRLMVEDDGFCHLAAEHLRASYFDNAAFGWMYDRIAEHWRSYQRPASFVALYEYLRELDPTISSQFQPAVMQLEQTPVQEPEFISDRVVEFIKRNLFYSGMEELRALYNKGDVEAAFDFWMRRGDEINQVSLGDVDRGWFFLELEERQRRRVYEARNQHLHTFSTGIKQLDKVLNGGLSLGEMGVWLAKQKIGKSMMLEWLAFWAVRALRIPVLVTIHEGSRRYWEDRLEAAFAYQMTNLIAIGEMDRQTHDLLLEEYKSLSRLLVLRSFTKDFGVKRATVGDIEAELTELRTREGFIPKMIVCDYGDLLRSRFRVEKETDHQTDAFKDLKGLSDKDNGYAVWTASQVQRLPGKADMDPKYFVRAEQVADAIGKVRVADFYGSLNRTVEEKEQNRLRVYAEEYRHGKAGVAIEVETDYARGRFIKSILADVEVPPEAYNQDLL